MNAAPDTSGTTAPSNVHTATETLRGHVAQVVYEDRRQPFSIVVLVDDDGRQHKVVSQAPALDVGQRAHAKGVWETHKLGPQLRAHYLAREAESDWSFLARYIANAGLPGLGTKRAHRLVAALGRDAPYTLARDPQRVAHITGIQTAQALAIQTAWCEQIDHHRRHLQLEHAGLGPKQAANVVDAYGKDAIERFRGDPYAAIRYVEGIGFLTADRCARRGGALPDDPARIRASIEECLRVAGADGHCGVPTNQLVSQAAELLAIDDEISNDALALPVADELTRLVATGDLADYNTPVGQVIQLPHIAHHERRIAAAVQYRLGQRPALPRRELPPASWAQLSPSQREALDRLHEAPLALLVGGPGTGKTTLTHAFLQSTALSDEAIILCAPTGRAANRLSESTGREARTLHSVLQFQPHRHRFGRNRNRPLAARLVLVDEASMLDTALFRHLLDALPADCHMVLCGDPDQLPAVLPGEVLADLVSSGRIPTAQLTEIHRTAEGSAIPQAAQRLLHEGYIDATTDLADDVCWVDVASDDELRDRTLAYVRDDWTAQNPGHDAREDVQILTPVHRTDTGTRELNAALQAVLNPECIDSGSGKPGVGDRIMHLTNNPDQGVYNGDLGVVTHHGQKGQLEVEVNGQHITLTRRSRSRIALAYAVTVHKAQGSEVDTVVIPLSRSHSFMLDRRLLYTAMTRAQSRVVFIGRRRMMVNRIARAPVNRRVTTLVHRLMENER